MNQLEEIKARVEKASLGPWGAVKGSEYDGVDTLSGELTWDDHNGEVFKPEDADFIAHARTDVPKLLAALEAVEALAEQWRYKGEFGWGAWQEGHGPDPEGHVLDSAASDIRKAIKEALQ